MGIAVLVLGDSGSGKSTSLRNFEPGEIGIISVKGKRLPFRSKMQIANLGNKRTLERYAIIAKTLEANNLKAYVIDDCGYLMQDENIERIKEKGYEKFAEIAQHFVRTIDDAKDTDDDTIVYFMMHYDRDDSGRMKPKTIGRLLDEKYCIEGVFDVTIQACVQDGEHVFVNKNDGYNAVRGGMGMLPDVMDNDLKAVDTAIREYWDMEPLGGGSDA